MKEWVKRKKHFPIEAKEEDIEVDFKWKQNWPLPQMESTELPLTRS